MNIESTLLFGVRARRPACDPCVLHAMAVTARTNARFKHLLVDEYAAAVSADEITVRDELLVGGDDSVARDVELSREFATGWQFHAGRKRTVDDAVNELLPNLILQVYPLTRIYVDKCILHLFSIAVRPLAQVPRTVDQIQQRVLSRILRSADTKRA